MIPPEPPPSGGNLPADQSVDTKLVAPLGASPNLAAGVQLIGIRLAARDGREGRFASGESVVLTVVLFSEVECTAASVRIGLADRRGQVVFATSTKPLDLDLKLSPGVCSEVSLVFPVNLSPGRFTINLQCWGGPADRPACFLSNEAVCEFEVHNPWLPEFTGMVFLPVQARAAEWRQTGKSCWMAPLLSEQARAAIELQGANNRGEALQVNTGAMVELPLGITNLSDRWIASNPPYPVVLSYHINNADDTATIVFDGRRTRLKSPIPPAGAITQTMLLDAPQRSGRYWVHLSLVQEGRFWFDALPGNHPERFALLVSA
jgi:Wzt C-terminal domain